MSTKTCSRCKEEKDTDLFIKKRNICKACSNEAKKKSKAKKANMDPETIIQCTTCDEKKKYALFVKGTKKCKDCDNKRRKANYEKKKANISDTKQKKCSLCKDEKVESEFNPGFAVCKVCQQVQKKARNDKLKQNLPDSKECKECGLTQEIDQFRIGENVCYTCSKLRTYEWRKNNPEGFQKICEKYRQKDDYREKQNKSKKERYHNNPTERIGRNYRCYLRDYLFKGRTTKNIDDIVGLSPEKMKDWLEYNFEPGMTWDNYGTFWNLDHVMPCSSFDLEDELQLYECFSWKNTMPVYYKENLEKFNKVKTDLKQHIELQAEKFMNPKVQYHLKKQKKMKKTEEKIKEDNQEKKEKKKDKKKKEKKIDDELVIDQKKIDAYFENIVDSEEEDFLEEERSEMEKKKQKKKNKKGKKKTNFKVIKTVMVN